MIRQMRYGEEDQAYWRKQVKSLGEYLVESNKIFISKKINGKNVILIAEEDV